MEGGGGFHPLIQFGNGSFSGRAIQARNKWPNGANKGLDETKGNVSFEWKYANSESCLAEF